MYTKDQIGHLNQYCLRSHSLYQMKYCGVDISGFAALAPFSGPRRASFWMIGLAQQSFQRTAGTCNCSCRFGIGNEGHWRVGRWGSMKQSVPLFGAICTVEPNPLIQFSSDLSWCSPVCCTNVVSQVPNLTSGYPAP
jgi:hypothetical protein